MATDFNIPQFGTGATPGINASRMQAIWTFLNKVASGGSGSVVKADLASDSLLLNGKNLTAQRKLSEGLICAPKANIPEYPDNVAGTKYKWNKTDTDSWTSSNATLTFSGGVLVLTASTTDPIMARAVTPFSGANSTTIRIRFRQTQGVLGSGLGIFANTDTIYKYTPYVSAGLNVWQTLDIDMTGGLVWGNWIGSTITDIRIDLPDNAASLPCVIEISDIYFGDGTYSSLALDASGNGNHGSVFGCTPVAGITGRALSFDGVNDDFRNTAMPAFGDEISISCWLNRRALINAASGAHMVFTFASFNAYGSRLYFNNNSTTAVINFFRAGASESVTLTNLLDISLNAMITLTYKISTKSYTVYKNGIVFQSGTLTNTPVAPTTLLYFGSNAGVDAFYAGTIDEPRIYNRALSAQEIWELYQNPGGNCINDMVMANTPVANSVAVRTSTGILEANGIKFPGALKDGGFSTDVQTLDDYEEGTFTPGLTFGGTPVTTYGAALAGKYTKIGKTVRFTVNIPVSVKGAGSGVALVTGLPFTAANTNADYTPVSLHVNGAVFSGFLQGHVNQNATTITLRQITDAGVLSELTQTSFGATPAIIVSGVYEV
jgi:hypothetical protein